MFLSKYGEARHIYIPIVKRAVVDFAVSADWTPAAGDVKISKDGGAAANVTNLPTAITMGNTAMWDFSLTATEMQAAQIVVMVADSATKAVEDQSFVIETYGHASAQHAFDLDTASTAQTGDSYARLGAPAGASVSADIAAIEAQTDDIGVAGAGLTAVPWNAAWDAEVQSEVADALDAAIPALPTADSINERIKTMDDADLPGDVAAVKADTAAILLDTGTDGVAVANGAISSLKFAAGALDAAALAADAANEIRDAVWAKAMTELAAVPGVTDSVLAALEWVFLLARNKVTQTATTQTLRNDADTLAIATAGVSDDGTTFIRNEFA